MNHSGNIYNLDPELTFINEPNLSFGYGQKTADPRDGLMLFGPYDHLKIKGQINVGIIGSKPQREYLKDYLKKLHQPVLQTGNEIARPFFPGLQSAFGIHINFDNLVELEVDQNEITKFLFYADGHQRVHNLTNLFADQLIRYTQEEERPVTVWFVVIQDDIYKFGRPKSKLPKSAENIKLGLKKNQRNTAQSFLFPEMEELKDAYTYEINFHNQLKAKLLKEKIVTQIIREGTIAYDQIITDEKKRTATAVFDSAKAWNISTTLYYKIGGLPWRLGDIREDVCYLGLVYKKLNEDPNNRSACCAAQMFIDSGDGMVFRGNIGDFFNPKTKEFHISKNDAINLISNSLEVFKEKLGKGNYPKEIFIHAKTYFDDHEWEGFSDAVKDKSKIIGVRIQPTSEFKLFRQFSFCVPRGMIMKVGTHKAFLWTKGFIPRLQTQVGLEVPNPISVEVTRGDADIEQVCKDVLALTKLNYNACIFADGQPVTLRFADSIGEVLTAGKNITNNILPFKHYV
ncbi:hypothetical protein ABIE26_000823 [Pedobacter africanus]|uniref:Uncharacterized protein n=1 Tax=Pedobacter africanus TaxID=151894 RepID=A0ACC6KU15_9SPHI|nr:hypothetical protein [Pedobacter africanus]MDR6782690.1 hypothetical protein [Pedobacter africanus]